MSTMTVQQWLNRSGDEQMVLPTTESGDIEIGLVKYCDLDGEFHIYKGQGFHDDLLVSYYQVSNGPRLLECLLHLHKQEWITGQHIKDFLDCLTLRVYRDSNLSMREFFGVAGALDHQKLKVSCMEKAVKMFPDAACIAGNGQFAVVTHCRQTTVALWDNEEEAREAYNMIAKSGCCGKCTRDHRLIKMDTELIKWEQYNNPNLLIVNRISYALCLLERCHEQSLNNYKWAREINGGLNDHLLSVAVGVLKRILESDKKTPIADQNEPPLDLSKAHSQLGQSIKTDKQTDNLVQLLCLTSLKQSSTIPSAGSSS
jgi:hypothetical protein